MAAMSLAGALLYAAPGQAADPAWSYEGAGGPAHWGALAPGYATCELGKNQSPVDIRGTVSAALPRLRIHYPQAGKTIVNNGHSIQVAFGPGNVLTLDGEKFQMQQVHFHAPSEHRIKGKSYPLEAHFVHADKQGNLAVVAVLYQLGRANPGITRLWAQMPAEPGQPVALKSTVRPSALMPVSLSYYRYSGSLTTPPCTEGVRWLVLSTPLSVSQAQVDAFTKVMHHATDRPVQPLNGRVILH
jgi:carbonic anhydrase